MDITFFQNIERILTKERLSVYRKDNADNTIALARYLYNIELCKSLYALLHIFEICLRNTIDFSFTEFSKTQNWFDTIILDTEATNKIEKAKNNITRHGKPISHDRIIAEMTLGFWTSFLTTRYSQNAFQSYLIKNSFSNCPKSLRNIKSLQNIFEKMRILRNRVSHYERVIHWKDLKQQHEQLLTCIKWLNTESYQVALEIDTFNTVCTAGIKPFIELISSKWNDSTEILDSLDEKKEVRRP